VTEHYDAVVVGGGSAGMAAALWLARYRRRTLLIDAGDPRNRATWAVHGYPGLADPSPAELRSLTLAQMLAAGAERREARVTAISGGRDEFVIRADRGDAVSARRVLLAFGLKDDLPALAGVTDLYGRSVFHCPDCDGPSMAGARVGVLGADRHAAQLALYLLTWAREVVLLANGAELALPDAALQQLAQHGVEIVTERLLRLERAGEALAACAVEGRAAIRMDGLFFHFGSAPAAPLARELGCAHDENGFVQADGSQETSVRGIYAAGDLTGKPHLAIWAAAEGVRAALAMHRSLLPPELELT
jgi:thioredoxin reductase